MNKSPVNHILTIAIGAILWVVFAILMGTTLSENPNLASKDPTVLAGELRIIFGVAALLSIICCSYWYYYGSQESTAGELPKAKSKWRLLFFLQVIFAVGLTVTLVLINMDQGIESKWFIIYFALLSVLTFIFFWIATYLMSPRTVQYIPFGR